MANIHVFLEKDALQCIVICEFKCHSNELLKLISDRAELGLASDLEWFESLGGSSSRHVSIR